MNTIKEFVPEDFTPDKEVERKEAAFKDFLVLKRISGELQRKHKTDLIPRDIVQESGETVIIEIPPEEQEHQNTTLMIHRNDNDDIVRIELVCSCSKKHVIKFLYEEITENSSEETDETPETTSEESVTNE
ncbi:MAG: hypothetical protein JNL36_06015 [Candidatus Kapabacteria bacterium]|nr:hypothetical protein [Candidatus Kapabacteria bacterium]